VQPVVGVGRNAQMFRAAFGDAFLQQVAPGVERSQQVYAPIINGCGDCLRSLACNSVRALGPRPQARYQALAGQSHQ
jgi:hypothetical protein